MKKKIISKITFIPRTQESLAEGLQGTAHTVRHYLQQDREALRS